jgi:formamidopyrimidine-DNA glycosylase
MPELPEVETIRADLEKKILHKKIVKVEVLLPKIVKNKPYFFKNNLLGKSFSRLDRAGKLLLFALGSGKFWLLIHLKMTGQLIYQKKNKITIGGHSFSRLDKILPNKYSYVIFIFQDGARLFFNDLRQFGYIKLVSKSEKELIVAKYGIEPLQQNFTEENFINIFKKKKTILKALLLNQQLIAGIGNIYADEICFRAGVRPSRLVNTLSLVELKKIYLASQQIIRLAIKHRGTTFNDYVDAQGNKGNYLKYLQVYGRLGKICKKCKREKIKKIKLAGRGTHYCSNCQE